MTATQALTTSAPMPFAEYLAKHGLSHSAMKDLAVSPLRFWHKHLSPDRPADEPSAEMQFGSALHCAVLERDQFGTRYCCEIDEADYPDALRTMDDLKSALKEAGLPSTAKLKQELVDRVTRELPNVPILDVIRERHEIEHAGKVRLKRADWFRVGSAAFALMSEPRIAEILGDGRPEVSYFATDPETGVLLKCRTDWVAPTCSMDVKTFSQMRGKTIDRSVTDALWYEGYLRQAAHNAAVRAMQSGCGRMLPFVFAFVESEPPHEVRIRVLKPGGDLYWMTARNQVRQLIRLYADCVARFGDSPWREERDAELLRDDEIPQLMYA